MDFEPETIYMSNGHQLMLIIRNNKNFLKNNKILSVLASIDSKASGLT